MALPKVNDVPKYELIIPSTQKQVMFRPYLVKEQKILLMAMESQDEKEILRSVIETIKACVYDDIKIENLATFDVEYIFTQIRSKSVGESTTLNLKCIKCEEGNEVVVPLNDIKIDIDKEKKLIKINDNYTLEMKYPKYSAILLAPEDKEGDSLTEALYETAIMCMGYLITEDEKINFDDETRESIDSFLGSLTASQFEKIMDFVLNLPKITYDLDYKCTSCEHENKITLQGIQDFF